MGFFSVAAPIVGSIIGSKLTNSAAKSAANNANAFTELQLKNRHQWEVADLKKAGLNPILSAGGTPSIGGSSTAAVTNPVGDVASALQLSAQLENIEADTQLKKDQSSQAVNTALREQATQYLLTKQAEAQGYDNVSKKLEADIMGSQAGTIIKGVEKLGGVASGLASTASSAKSIGSAVKAGAGVWKKSPALDPKTMSKGHKFPQPRKSVTKYY